MIQATTMDATSQPACATRHQGKGTASGRTEEAIRSEGPAIDNRRKGAEEWKPADDTVILPAPWKSVRQRAAHPVPGFDPNDIRPGR